MIKYKVGLYYDTFEHTTKKYNLIQVLGKMKVEDQKSWSWVQRK